MCACFRKNPTCIQKIFNCGYSPERINQVTKSTSLKKLLKLFLPLIKTLNILKYIYGKIIEAKVVTAPSIIVAEAAKVIENTQRDLNIALANELSIICSKLKIDTKK